MHFERSRNVSRTSVTRASASAFGDCIADQPIPMMIHSTRRRRTSTTEMGMKNEPSSSESNEPVAAAAAAALPAGRKNSITKQSLKFSFFSMAWLAAISLLLPTLSNAQSSCPLEMHVFADSANCNVQTTADAVGTLYPDDTCRSTELVSGDSPELLPGNYRASCSSDGRVQIYESGCTSSTCAATNGGSVCERQLDYASLYSRLSPPLYKLQSQNASFVSCFALSSSDETYQVVFFIYGDCTPCISATPSPATADTNQPTAVFVTPSFPSTSTGPTVRPTLRPTEKPTPAPTTFEPTVPGIDQGNPPFSKPTTKSPSPAASGGSDPTFEPTFSSTGGTTGPTAGGDKDNVPTNNGNNGGASAPARAPNAKPSSPSSPTQPSSNETISASSADQGNMGVVIGSVVGVIAALACFLTTGFLLGRRLQASDSRKSLSEAGSQANREQSPNYLHSSTPLTMSGSMFHSSSPGTPGVEAPVAADHNIMISIDDQDDISTLEDPTVYTRDTQTTRDSVLGTTFLDHDADDEVPTVASHRTKETNDSTSLLMGAQYLRDTSAAASVSESVANDSRANHTAASSAAGGGLGNQTTSSRMTNETSSVIGLNFLSDLEEPSQPQRKLFGGAPQPQAEDDEDDASAAWRPGAKWFGVK
ncbi:hypothetical protein MPSEU_000002200 [Mayamaea pseudoterrestris]|nr:hypothetical protein MPSEU_000002200 [Mayamaea pseudoterrestris]